MDVLRNRYNLEDRETDSSYNSGYIKHIRFLNRKNGQKTIKDN